MGDGQGPAGRGARRHAQDQEARRGAGRRQEAVQAEGDGQRAPGIDAVAQFVGGGKVGGPQPRDYSYTVPKKVKRAALASALSLRAQEKKLVIVDAFSFDAPKTKTLAGILKTLGAEKAVVVDGKGNINLSKSARNLTAPRSSRPRAQRLRHPQPPRPRDRRRRRQGDRGARPGDAGRRREGRVRSTMRSPEQIIKRPLLTEKGTRLKDTGGRVKASSIPRR